MACIHNNFHGYCTLSDKESPCEGVDLESYDENEESYQCAVDEDPDPRCDSYESDYRCDECGADLNQEECDCDDE